MPSRSVRRRRQHKHMARLGEDQRRAVGIWHLTRWRAEANRRAKDMGEPAVWALAASVRDEAMRIDPTGELAAELSRVCAEAVSRASGSDLMSRSRRRAERMRLANRR